MAEINTSTKNKDKKYLHKSIRVDLTPMVDLGFLLITFFILTTTMQANTALKLILPKDSPDSTKVSGLKTLTFILTRNDSIGYYDGLAKEISYINFGAMRRIIQQKQVSLTNNHINKNELILIIKPTTESSYKNFIDALDEIYINDCKHYFVAEPGENEILKL
ncbi:MAG: outer rane transport energization protein ExbD [Chitinophagaceae bacterium]|nr:outer rane transport energization protein ExbD [Chitinophagaceae bacterium]